MSTTLETFDGGVETRPSDCECLEAFHDLPCWKCYREGFDEPNPDAGDDE